MGYSFLPSNKCLEESPEGIFIFANLKPLSCKFNLQVESRTYSSLSINSEIESRRDAFPCFQQQLLLQMSVNILKLISHFPIVITNGFALEKRLKMPLDKNRSIFKITLFEKLMCLCVSDCLPLALA